MLARTGNTTSVTWTRLLFVMFVTSDRFSFPFVFVCLRVKNVVASSMKVKLASYCLALLLHINHQTANLTRLYQDLGFYDSRCVQ